MTCPSCGTNSCYVCGIKLVPRGDIKYWHFKGSRLPGESPECPIYFNFSTYGKVVEENNKFNKERTRKELQNLIVNNTDDPTIISKLYSYIGNAGYILDSIPDYIRRYFWMNEPIF